MNAHRFYGISLNGRVTYNRSIIGTPYFSPARVPAHFKVGVTSDNVDQFFGFTPDGECINIYSCYDCGHCIECAQRKQRDIRSRMTMEQIGYDSPPIFLTLTYNDKYLPADGVCKRDVSLFFKRLHTNLARAGYNSSFKHICFSEYGTQRGRAHYHAIIFGLDYTMFTPLSKLLEFIEKSWSCNPKRQKDTADSLGFCYVKICDGKVFDYVSKYVAKDYILNLDGSFESEYESIKKRNQFRFKSKDGVIHTKNVNFVVSSRRFGSIGTTWLKTPEVLSMLLTEDYPKVSVRDKFGNVFNFVLPKFLRDKIYPSLSKLLPKRVSVALRSLGKDIWLLNDFHRRGCQLDTYEQKFLQFPETLSQRYYLWYHLYNPLLVDPNDDYMKRYRPGLDVYGCLCRIQTSLDILENFYFSVSDFVQILEQRCRLTNKFVRSALSFFNSRPEYTSSERYGNLKNFYDNFYYSRPEHSQKSSISL